MTSDKKPYVFDSSGDQVIDQNNYREEYQELYWIEKHCVSDPPCSICISISCFFPFFHKSATPVRINISFFFQQIYKTHIRGIYTVIFRTYHFVHTGKVIGKCVWAYHPLGRCFPEIIKEFLFNARLKRNEILKIDYIPVAGQYPVDLIPLHVNIKRKDTIRYNKRLSNSSLSYKIKNIYIFLWDF